MSIKSMDLSWIVVSDFKKAIKYYTEVVGLKLHTTSEQHGWAELIGADGGSVLGIAQHSGYAPIPPGHNAIVTFTVDDIVKYKNDISKKGVKFIGDIMEVPGHVKLLLCEDSDGNKFQIVQVLHKE